MKIEILGTGCSKCKQLEENAKKAVAEKNLNAEIIKVTDVEEIMSYGMMSTPAIVIDGEIKMYGRVASVNEIIKWL